MLAWVVAATVIEVGGLVAVVHTLLRHAMTARGMAEWALTDTLLTSPLLWTGAALAGGALNRLVAVSGVRAGRDELTQPGAALTVAAVVVGAAMMWFGLRAVGKLY